MGNQSDIKENMLLEHLVSGFDILRQLNDELKSRNRNLEGRLRSLQVEVRATYPQNTFSGYMKIRNSSRSGAALAAVIDSIPTV